MDTVANIARGTIFGAALTLSGVYLPSVIIGQLAFRDFHMLQAFLTASATSALILAVSKDANKPKRAASLGLFSPYDGNIIGGAMVGAGMALTGACPGTVMVQVATGVPSALPVLLGGLIGGITYVTGSKLLRRPQVSKETLVDAKPTLPSKLNLDPLAAVVAYEGILSSVVIAVSKLRPHSPRLLNPVFGGLAIGAAQLSSVILTHDALGTSTAYEDVGKWVSWLASKVTGSQKDQPSARPSAKTIVFAASIVLGSWIFGKIYPELILKESMPISPAQGFIGGFTMILGARLAQGCTSGHGISGMAVLSVASLYTVASMFAGGIALALSLGI